MKEIKIIAVVKFNDGEAYVLNRKPVMLYNKIGNIMFAKDGAFYDCLKYRIDQYGEAFAGRKFEVPLVEGGFQICDGKWWDDGYRELENLESIKLTRVTVGTIEELQKCYVFTGLLADAHDISFMRSEYNGAVYPYWDYEKIIKFDKQRSEFFDAERKLKSRVKSLIREVKAKHTTLKFLRGI